MVGSVTATREKARLWHRMGRLAEEEMVVGRKAEAEICTLEVESHGLLRVGSGLAAQGHELELVLQIGRMAQRRRHRSLRRRGARLSSGRPNERR